MTAEDDRVAAEAESDGEVVNEKHYHNFYHLLAVVRDGKIREMKEYHDTKYAAEVFGDLISHRRTETAVVLRVDSRRGNRP